MVFALLAMNWLTSVAHLDQVAVDVLATHHVSVSFYLVRFALTCFRLDVALQSGIHSTIVAYIYKTNRKCTRVEVWMEI